MKQLISTLDALSMIDFGTSYKDNPRQELKLRHSWLLKNFIRLAKRMDEVVSMAQRLYKVDKVF